MKIKDMSGQKIGKLTVIKRAENPRKDKNKNTGAFWLCKCDCGNEIITSGSNLRNIAYVKTCGCGRKETNAKINKKDLTGQRFARWTVLKEEPGHILGTGYFKWVCKCDCGTIKSVTSAKLISGHTKSCGCLKKEKSRENGKKNRRNNNIISDSHINRLYHQAKYRNIEFNLNSIYLNNLFLQQDKKCALSGIDIKFSETCEYGDTTASLDRIDSSKGYTEGNVQWVHKDINRMKMDMDEKVFIEWCRLIANNIGTLCLS